MLKLILSAVLFATLSSSHADEASIRAAVEKRFGAQVDRVTKTEYLGLYEVFAEGQIIYTDEKASVFLVGNLIDGRTGQNITGKRLFSMLPLQLAAKQTRGKGTGVLVSFEDPNCGYCKRLAKDMQKLKDVTIYTFLYPILGEDSVAKTKDIWCAKDRAKAWNDWMINNTIPGTASAGCAAPIDQLIAIGQSFQVTGTPTLLFEDGTRVPGAVPVADIEKKLAQLAQRN